MSRKQSATRLRAAAPTVSPPLTADGSSHHGMLAWLAALLAARWLIPTEGAAEGLTLWLVQLVLLTAVGRSVWVWRLEERGFRFDVVDGAIALLITAQVVSAMLVVFGIGNARTAINVAWEWIGSGVLIWMLRQELTSRRVIRELCLGLSLTAGVLAGFGLWQHYVGYKETSREYDRLTSEHDRLAERMHGGSVTAADVRKLETLRAEMTRQQIPIEKNARQSLESRLKHSSEPLGLFALANTFAGLLVVMGLLAAGLMGGGRTSQIALALLVALIAFCILLTKSRTAMVGLFAGMSWWVLQLVIARREESVRSERRALWRRIGIWCIVGVSALGGAVGIAALSGGWDLAVMTQAPKSLRYRLEWWHGTWATILEHFWFGTGPGNFRDYYLAHKLPESSEEIVDPHNFLFDVWANAGTFGLIGLLMCVGLMLRKMLQPNREDSRNLSIKEDLCSEKESRPLWSAGVCGVGLAFPLSAIGMELIGHGTDERLWWLGGIWWGIWLIGILVSHRMSADLAVENGDSQGVAIRFSLEAANVALLVHLLGAGGIAMPAATQLLWLVWAMRWTCSEALPIRQDEKSPSEFGGGGVKAGHLPAGILALAVGGLCVLCGWTATLPEMACRTSLQIGENEWGRGQFTAANQRYLEAARVDSWALEPLERLADAAFQRWQASQAERDFEESVKFQQAVITRLPFASRPYRRLGQLWMARFERSRNRADAERAVEAFASAVERYPYHAGLRAELAIANEQAGLDSQAREMARQSLHQDDINRSAGHSDKFLDPEARRRMERLAGAALEPN